MIDFIAGVPLEMRERPQWCLAGADKAPVLPKGGNLYNASPVQGPWMAFDDAVQAARHFGCSIGYVLTADDPFTCIDLDVKDAESVGRDGLPLPAEKHTPDVQLEEYRNLISTFASYTELSSGGKGLHIWVRGAIGEGRRRAGVEVYSQERFIVVTGNTVSALAYWRLNGTVLPIVQNRTAYPVEERQNLLSQFVGSMEVNTGAGGTTLADVPDGDVEFTDEEIYNKLQHHENGKKFLNLWGGFFTEYASMPTQSEADMALMSMIAFYSRNNEQCVRMFRSSALGQRDKAQREDYMARTLRIIRGRQAREDDQKAKDAEFGAQAARALVEQLQAERMGALADASAAASAAAGGAGGPVLPPQAPGGLPWPPGMAGALAGFIHDSSPRPVPEVAITAALGLLAGITGKAYNVSGTGINGYFILVARSAIGKEAMHSGIGLVCNSLRDTCGELRFVSYDEYASGPALIKALSDNPSMVNVSGEWGRRLKRMAAEDGRGEAMATLRTALTNLYQKSGYTDVAGGISYSDKDKNAELGSAAYSLIGETTPGTFYESLTSTMMEDGFLSRFNIIAYEGERPRRNMSPTKVMDDRLKAAMTALVMQAKTILAARSFQQVGISSETLQLLDAFDEECDNKIAQAGDDETRRQMWNRAHLKVLRVASLLAVADNPITPVMTVGHAQWAEMLIRRDIALMIRRMEEGDVGLDDSSRVKKLLSFCKQYLTGESSINQCDTVKFEAMRKNGIVTRRYLQLRAGGASAFKQGKMSLTQSLDMAIRAAIDSGYIMEVEKMTLVDKYEYRGSAYRVLDV